MLGGYQNTAFADRSVVAGAMARANHMGSMIFGDTFFGAGEFVSQAENEFAGRFTGGVRFANTYTPGGEIVAASLKPGSTSWSVNCSETTIMTDRVMEDPDSKHMLLDFVSMPLHRWNYDGDAGGVMHVSPTAENFIAAFSDDLNYEGSPEAMANDSIDVMDAIGVTMVSLQEFYRRYEAESAVLWGDVSKASSEANTANIAVQAMLTSIDDHTTRIQQLETTNTQHELRIAQLESVNATQQAAIDDLIARVTALESSDGGGGGRRTK